MKFARYCICGGYCLVEAPTRDLAEHLVSLWNQTSHAGPGHLSCDARRAKRTRQRTRLVFRDVSMTFSIRGRLRTKGAHP